MRVPAAEVIKDKSNCRPQSYEQKACGCLKMWGNKGRLGSDWSWHIIFDEKNRIDAFLTENGGEALPDKVMSEDGEICYANGNVRNIPQGALKCKKYPYRPLVKADKG